MHSIEITNFKSATSRGQKSESEKNQKNDDRKNQAPDIIQRHTTSVISEGRRIRDTHRSLRIRRRRARNGVVVQQYRLIRPVIDEHVSFVHLDLEKSAISVNHFRETKFERINRKTSHPLPASRHFATSPADEVVEAVDLNVLQIVIVATEVSVDFVAIQNGLNRSQEIRNDRSVRASCVDRIVGDDDLVVARRRGQCRLKELQCFGSVLRVNRRCTRVFFILGICRQIPRVEE